MTDLESWLARARRVDEMAFDVLLTPDHLGTWPPFIPLVAAARASSATAIASFDTSIPTWT